MNFYFVLFYDLTLPGWNSNLPDFLGGSCKCPEEEGGCMQSDMGPWRDPDVLKVIRDCSICDRILNLHIILAL